MTRCCGRRAPAEQSRGIMIPLTLRHCPNLLHCSPSSFIALSRNAIKTLANHPLWSQALYRSTGLFTVRCRLILEYISPRHLPDCKLRHLSTPISSFRHEHQTTEPQPLM